MDYCLKCCCEIIEKLETKIKEEKNNNISEEVLELYENLLMETYKFLETNIEDHT